MCVCVCVRMCVYMCVRVHVCQEYSNKTFHAMQLQLIAILGHYTSIQWGTCTLGYICFIINFNHNIMTDMLSLNLDA